MHAIFHARSYAIGMKDCFGNIRGLDISVKKFRFGIDLFNTVQGRLHGKIAIAWKRRRNRNDFISRPVIFFQGKY